VVALTAAALYLGLVTPPVPAAGYEAPDGLLLITMPLFLLVSALVGSVVARRRPENIVGWLFILIPGSLAFGLLGDTYAVYSRYVMGGPDEMAIALDRAASAISPFAFFGLAMLALLFPTGRPPTRTWARMYWLLVPGAVLFIFVQIFLVYDPADWPPPPPAPVSQEVLRVLEKVASLLVLSSVILGVASLVVRARRARGEERQQLKWFLYAVTLTGVALTASVFSAPWPYLNELSWVVAMSTLALWPMTAGMAILRYRLYDIDLLINRTLVYGSLTAMLGAAYVGSVLLLQAVLRPFTAENELAVAVSTLGVVALFQPLRRRIQDWVDRRFYRSRYDAQLTLDAFAARLRGDVDLDSVRSDLVSVLQETVRPSHATVWLREDR
jgi:hypothetical protein